MAAASPPAEGLWPRLAAGNEDWLFVLMPGSIPLLLTLRWLLDRVLYKPVARRALLKDSATKAIPKKTLHNIDRFCESFWKCTAYSSLLCIGAYALYDQPWLWHTAELWRGWPHYELPGKVQLYYASQLAFYSSSLVMLFSWEERRKDFGVMLLHHIVTVVLIAVSHITGFGRVGSIIMILHDPSDIFLEAAKMGNYAGLNAPVIASFALLLITWFGLRLVVLPGVIIPSIWFELPAILGHHNGIALGLSLLLCLLVVLHIYWFYLIVQIAVNVARGEVRDTREAED
ncbi:hypothetical protein WJX73_000695 [Symbiochloris irregularis]|uniref:TLC domain-containing protein n=1 Tax=Symbiochloris irregularis TaxID=706552 RepID=A0AAW1P958_9CHLO